MKAMRRTYCCHQQKKTGVYVVLSQIQFFGTIKLNVKNRISVAGFTNYSIRVVNNNMTEDRSGQTEIAGILAIYMHE